MSPPIPQKFSFLSVYSFNKCPTALNSFFSFLVIVAIGCMARRSGNNCSF